MRLLHSSDWHLGRTLCGERRDAAFKAFLDWLLELIDARAIDTLLIAGDIFDSAMPPISAQNQYYEFLAATSSLFRVTTIPRSFLTHRAHF